MNQVNKDVEQFGRVGVLFGGTSAEREVSLQSGAAIVDALRQASVDVVPVDIGQQPVEAIQKAKLDRAFIALHGPGGEDGTIQALLKFLSIPFTGSGVQASALAMDKLKSKTILSAQGIPTPPYKVLNDDSDWEQILAILGGSVIVKPAHEGSSIGMTKARTALALEQAYKLAKQYDRAVFAESLIVGPEYTVSVLGQKSLPAIRLETDNDFYDYEAKYLSDETRYLCPCGLPEDQERKLARLSLDSFNALDCHGWGRVDFMADEAGEFYVLEVNTVPGMTSHSLVPMAAKQQGLNFQQLCLEILQQTMVSQ